MDKADNKPYIEVLNEYMANLKIEVHNLENMHHNIVGASFMGMHRKIKEYQQDIQEMIQKVLARIKMLDGFPLTNFPKIEEASTIKSMRSMDFTGNQVLDVMKNDFHFLKDYTKDLVSYFEESKDYYTVSILMKNLVYFEEEGWMIQNCLK